VTKLLKTPAQIERTALRRGLSMVQVCRMAEVSYSTWSRWKNGLTCPSIDIYEKLVLAARPPRRARVPKAPSPKADPDVETAPASLA